MLLYLAYCAVLLAQMCFSSAQAAAYLQEPRIALVIGNAAYKDAALKNPVHDAKDIAVALRKLGFEVHELTDANQSEMFRGIADFGRRLANDKSAVGLFYYAGHGVQFKGKNYLIPVGSDISSEASVTAGAVNVDVALEQMDFAENRLNIVILDACRNNPFSTFRSPSTGLASINAPVGTLIAYATAPGRVARDGDGANGLYTSELLKAIQEPGKKLEDVFKEVRSAVSAKTAGNQVPWESSSLVGDFYFRASLDKNGAVALGRLQVRTSPSDAVIKIDGLPQGRGPSFDLSLRPRTYKVAVESAGYEPQVADVEISVGSRSQLYLSLTPLSKTVPNQAPPATLANSRSRLIVQVLPSDATIRVNGSDMHPGPSAIFDLPGGRHLVEVAKAGYVTQDRVVSLDGQKDENAIFLLVPQGEKDGTTGRSTDTFNSLPPP